MLEALVFVGFMVFWVGLQWFLLPRLGVPT